ncbi:hypothetical protein [Curtobacterium sp. Leaf261]|uniref:hypothetical protein n=1 Tax=Curtobacterium sp. Leaf261 TaxID=1736311 RepID=UPI0006F662FE|nr:hypothetical protein [Curtobacterium sp. Leaf261]KQO65212.1 hypothetical protein ASF23_03640 [Curtobacterium sp. Leaf261]
MGESRGRRAAGQRIVPVGHEQRAFLAHLLWSARSHLDRAGRVVPDDRPFGGRSWFSWYGAIDGDAADFKHGPVEWWDACDPLFDRLVDAGAMARASSEDEAAFAEHWGHAPDARDQRIPGYPYDPRKAGAFVLDAERLLAVVELPTP